jgi:hypothetical protein
MTGRKIGTTPGSLASIATPCPKCRALWLKVLKVAVRINQLSRPFAVDKITSPGNSALGRITEISPSSPFGI